MVLERDHCIMGTFEGEVNTTVLTPESFFDLSHFTYANIFDGIELVWETLLRLPEYAVSYFGFTTDHHEL